MALCERLFMIWISQWGKPAHSFGSSWESRSMLCQNMRLDYFYIVWSWCPTLVCAMVVLMYSLTNSGSFRICCGILEFILNNVWVLGMLFLKRYSNLCFLPQACLIIDNTFLYLSYGTFEKTKAPLYNLPRFLERRGMEILH